LIDGVRKRMSGLTDSVGEWTNDSTDCIGR